ncbi:ParB/RepB/Spo0J family partition protein [Mesorhizobium sp. NBSH29]|uniref:ParB/RepB/Spo0J family partition protein n=1 Tax=Mesorhizobium sp. NBSH29 TaxID=2654249 RepID=UPI00189682CF|nr:ParB/Srx family N-terminal domain-containing protein [Mesorhizobium sp. NBSH29]QPC87106.1 ParB/RepB/Spo0J family partition protein [Mesorhizobium sp. NBSH29]
MEINHQQFNVTFDRLVLDGVNARKKYDQDSIRSMKASILSYGIIQPLAVRPPQAGDADLGGQRYRVLAGGRRMRALAELIAEKELPNDFAIPVIDRDVDDRRALGMSLAENIIRREMSPTDEFRAFKDLADLGATTEDIALRFGQTERFVKGRLALGKLHPVILTAFENGVLGFAAAAAYTASSDPEAQLACFSRLDGSYQRNNPQSITSALRRESVRASSSLAEFITEERYLAAGGIVEQDLFGEEVYWSSAELIADLKDARLAEMREEALLEGWSFFETTEEFGEDIWSVKRLHPTQVALTPEQLNRLDAISELTSDVDPECLSSDELASYNALDAEFDELNSRQSLFTPDQMAISGVLIDTETMRVQKGVLRPSTAEKGGKGGADESTSAKAKDPLALSQPLKDIIGHTATKALQHEIVAQPGKALALLAAILEQSVNSTHGGGRPSRIKIETIDYGMKSDAKTREIGTSFAAYSKMEPEKLNKAIAALFAGTIDLTEKWFTKDFTADNIRDKTRTAFLTSFEADVKPHFDATAYFTSCSKPLINDALVEMTGNIGKGPKKSDMVVEAANACAATGWIPKPLRTKGWKILKA